MDEAERRFQACLERFAGELGDLVMRHVDEQVEAALAELAPSSADGATEAADSETVVELKLADLRPEKKAPAVPRVDPNSMLGAELSQVTSLESAPTKLEQPAVAPSVPPAPLFVHRRARDGRIHELSRARPQAVSEIPASG